MRRPTAVLVAGMICLAGGTVAHAHDADPSQPGSQAHDVGPYRVVDEVVVDLDSGTTTGRYTVTPSSADPRQTHVSLALPDCGHEVVAISDGGSIQNGDPSTGTPGPAVRWKGKHRTTEPLTYWYQVRGVYSSEDARMGIRSGPAYEGTVQRPSCERWTTDDDNENAEIPSGEEGRCRTALLVANDSDAVRTIVPPGTAGLRIRLLHHCAADPAPTTAHAWKVSVDGRVVAMMRSRSDLGGGGEHRASYELHLPVRAMERVCLHDPHEPPESGLCAPPP